MTRFNRPNYKPRIQSIPIDNYLRRIGLTADLPTLDFLRKIHKAHLLHIPYENLDIYFKKRILLDVRHIYKKVIEKNRGGIGFELNILFFHLLNSLGYNCSLISTCKWDGNNWGPEFDHPVVMTKIENGHWLSDVGSPSSFIEPKRIVFDQVQLDYNQYFKFTINPDQHYTLQKSSDCIEFQTVYQFELISRGIIEFLERFNYYQESDDSPLRKMKIASRYTNEGKVTLSDYSLVLEDKGIKKEFSILQEDDFASKLHEYFDIDYDFLFRQRLSK